MPDTCVARVPVFAGLSEEDQTAVAGRARPVHLATGEIAYAATDPTSRLLVVHTGRLKIFRLSADGSEQIVRILGPGDFTGETSILTGRPPDDYAAAMDDSQLCVFRHEDLEELVRQHPGIALRMLSTVSERLSATEQRLNALGSHDIESRLAGYLLGLRVTWLEGEGVVTLPMAKKDVASVIDASPESLSRALARLASRGLISVGEGRSVSIMQPALLQRLADGA
ncbi:Crp/Fnr family transcriptional regulator [Demequina sp. SO4-18]|uniref:Crp/Fnr family transcriptional regulator n=1 Tax=Demequina sp. SO4-18 TaxID=3401026 RepID=UPI003B5CC197